MRQSRMALLLVSFIASVSLQAADDFCRNYAGEDTGPQGEIRSYLVDEHASSDDTRASAVTKDGKKHWRIDLKGYLWSTAASGKHPILVYNHGHDATEPPCAVVNYFRAAGFLVFAPLRRGQGLSTGMNIEDAGKCEKCDDADVREAAEMFYLQQQSADIADAIKWISKQDRADPDRIAIMGHSYGGMAVLFANTTLPKGEGLHRAIIDISGGELTWNSNSAIRLLMPPAVQSAQYPILMLQPANGISLQPTYQLMQVASQARRNVTAHIYPAVQIDDPENDDVHTRFVKSQAQVRAWGPDVIAFLARNGVR